MLPNGVAMTGDPLNSEFFVFVRTWIGVDKGFDYDRFRTLHDTEMGDELEKQGWALGSRGEFGGWKKGSAFVSHQVFILDSCTKEEARLVVKGLNAQRAPPDHKGVSKYGWLDAGDLESGEGIIAYEESQEQTAECERARRTLEVVRQRKSERLKREMPSRAKRRRAPAPDGWMYLNDAEQKYGVPRSTLQDWLLQLPAETRTKDSESNQVLVEESALKALLTRKGRLPR